jgi:hypothetical protein
MGNAHLVGFDVAHRKGGLENLVRRQSPSLRQSVHILQLISTKAQLLCLQIGIYLREKRHIWGLTE